MANITNVADGKIRFNTESEQLFIDYDSQSVQITDFVKGLSEAQIRAIGTPSENKFYLASDSKILMYYANAEWNIITTTGAAVQIQADWNQTNRTKKDFIKNKPVVDEHYNELSDNAQSGKAVAEAIDSNIDQVYNEYSTKAQSGKAVAEAIASSTPDIATETTYGIVKPDNKTIKIDAGTLSANYVELETFQDYLDGLAAGTITTDDGIDYFIKSGTPHHMVADNISYNNGKTHLESNNVQDAIDESYSKINDSLSQIDKKITALNSVNDIIVGASRWTLVDPDHETTDEYPYTNIVPSSLYTDNFIAQFINIVPFDNSPYFTKDELDALNVLNENIIFRNDHLKLFAKEEIKCDLKIRVGGIPVEKL